MCMQRSRCRGLEQAKEGVGVMRGTGAGAWDREQKLSCSGTHVQKEECMLGAEASKGRARAITEFRVGA